MSPTPALRVAPADRFRRAAHVLLTTACFLATATAQAAPPAAAFKVSAAQMQALGVTLIKLETNSPAGGMPHAARVVLPPGQEQVVSAPVAGVVDQLLVAEQQTVRAGQPLLRLNSPQFGELQLKLIEATNRARLAARTLAREQQLLGEGIVPERRVQEAESAAMAEAARQKQAESALRLAGMAAADIQRIAAGNTLQDGLLVRAKTAGLVLGVDVKPGQRVQEADALLHLAQMQPLWLDIDVPAGPARQALPPATVIQAIGRDVSATTLSLGATVSDSQTVTLRARVTRGAALLRPGEVLQVQLPFPANSSGTSTAYTLPLQAVARQDEQAYVFVRSEDGFVARRVKVLSSTGQQVQVSGELQAGQQVAATSVIALKAAWQGKGGTN